MRPQLIIIISACLFSKYINLAFVRLIEATYQLKYRTFASAGFADNRYIPPLFYSKVKSSSTQPDVSYAKLTFLNSTAHAPLPVSVVPHILLPLPSAALSDG